MKALVQRVLEAAVRVEGEVVGAIGPGLLVFLAVEKGDGPAELEKTLRKTAGLRIFPDDAGRMNRSVQEQGGAVLVVSQFTLVADLKKGFRPSFSRAEAPERAAAMVTEFCRGLEAEGLAVAQGRFAADMQVSLVNDGPVTLWMDFPPTAAG